MKMLKIAYQGEHRIQIVPEQVTHFEYIIPEKNNWGTGYGITNIYLTSGVKVDIHKCTKQDYLDYIDKWRDALEVNMGIKEEKNPLEINDNSIGDNG